MSPPKLDAQARPLLSATPEPPRLRVIVTGASGFVGSHVVQALLAGRHPVAAIVRPTARAALFARAFPKVPLLTVAADGSTPADQIARFKPDALVHLATFADPAAVGSSARAAAQTNVQFAIDVLEKAISAGARLVVNTGTQSQHRTGEPRYAPTDYYAASKEAFEAFLVAYRFRARISAVTLRLSDTYGPGDPRRRILHLLLDAQASGAPVPLSPGEQKIDLVHVSDVARAFLMALGALARGTPLDDAYGVKTGRLLSLRDVAALVEAIGGRPIDARWGARDYPPGVIMSSFTPPPLPGWRPRISLETGIAQLVASDFDQKAAP